jgi:hypothetical protein
MNIKGNYLWMNFLCRFWYLLHIDLIPRKLCGEISHFFLLKCVIVAQIFKFNQNLFYFDQLNSLETLIELE